ncbi:hypothetical protein M8J75_012879 [Diaphorina citri]|nr:hypothetical protein M8J75_007285 [Diaphorina citri]KAI5710964.1 hypothetical protein M8J75_012879 [Diaphorina citri]
MQEWRDFIIEDKARMGAYKTKTDIVKVSMSRKSSELRRASRLRVVGVPKEKLEALSRELSNHGSTNNTNNYNLKGSTNNTNSPGSPSCLLSIQQLLMIKWCQSIVNSPFPPNFLG